MRDKRCLVTGQAAVKRARGGNFTGLEVAHIFPLMGVDKVRQISLFNKFTTGQLLKCSRSGHLICHSSFANEYARVGSQIIRTMPCFFEQIFIACLMTINGAYGYVNLRLVSYILRLFED